MSERAPAIQRQKTFPALRLFLGLIYVAAISAGLFFLPRMAPALLQMEHWTADWRTALFSDQMKSQHPDIAIIAITEETLSAYPYRSPIDRGLLSELIKFADDAGAKAIALDIIFDQPTETDKDEHLINAIKNAHSRIILGALDERVDLSEKQRKFQSEFLQSSGREIGYLNVRRDGDGVIRTTAPASPNGIYPVSFAGRIAQSANSLTQKAGPAGASERISWLRAPGDGSDTFLKIPAHVITRFSATPETAVAKVLAAKLRGKLVLIGADFKDQDRHTTPLSKLSGTDMTGLLVHAQILAQNLDGRHILRLSEAYEWPILLAIALIGVILGWRFKLKRFDFLVGLLATLILIGADFITFSQFRIILPFTTPFVAWILGVTGGYYLGTSFRKSGKV